MDTSSWIGLVSVIVAIVIFLITIWLNKSYRQKDSIKRFPPLNKKWAKPYFRLSSTDKKSVSRFIGFFNQVENELVELDVVVEDDALINVSREMLENENPLTNLMAGIIKLHVYMTPPSPAQEIDFVLEYDASYVTSALQG